MELATRAARRARLPGSAALAAAQAEHLLGEHGEVGLAPARLALQVEPLLLRSGLGLRLGLGGWG